MQCLDKKSAEKYNICIIGLCFFEEVIGVKFAQNLIVKYVNAIGASAPENVGAAISKAAK